MKLADRLATAAAEWAEVKKSGAASTYFEEAEKVKTIREMAADGDAHAKKKLALQQEAKLNKVVRCSMTCDHKIPTAIFIDRHVKCTQKLC
jgi:CRISPR/Cas system-associated protein Csx1